MSSDQVDRLDTLADIAAEIRAYGAQPPPRLMWLEIADRIEAAWKREREILIREEVSDNYHPNDWRVYVIEDKAGYFCGFTNKGAPGDVPMFCVSLDGAEKFDAFRDLCAREKAVAIRNRYVPNAKVWAYKRHEIFPEQYRKGDTNVKQNT